MLDKTYLIHYRPEPNISEQYSTMKVIARNAKGALAHFETWLKGTSYKFADDIHVCEVQIVVMGREE